MSVDTDTIDAPENALLCAYHLDGQGTGTQLSAVQTDRSATNSGFHWYHFKSDHADTPELMQSVGLKPNVIESLTADETRPRTMVVEDGVLLVLRGVNTNPGADPEDMVSIRLWFTKNQIISARKNNRKLLSVEDIRQSIVKGTGPKIPNDFVSMLIEYMADRIGVVVDDIDDELTRIETAVDQEDIDSARQSLSTTRRQTASIRRYLAPQRDALDTLFRNRSILTEKEAYDLHQHTDRMTRYVEDLDLARERALVLQEELAGQISQQQNTRMYVLSLVTAIFLPLSFLTGVFGMNVAGLPGTENPSAFIYLALFMSGIGLIVVAVMLWKKWW